MHGDLPLVALADQDNGKVELAVTLHDGRREAIARPEEPGRGLHLHHQRVDVRARQLLDERRDRRLSGPGVARARPHRAPLERGLCRCGGGHGDHAGDTQSDSDPFQPSDVKHSSLQPVPAVGRKKRTDVARPRVHDVRVADAVLLEGARVAARDAQRAVAQRHALGQAAGSRRILDADLPGLGSRWRAQAVDAAPAEVDERRAHAAAAQQIDRAVDSVALADAAEVELDAGAIEANRPVLAVEDDVAVPHDGERRLDLPLFRQPALVAEKSPRLHERPHRHVEGSVRVAAPAQAPGEHVDELGLHRDGPVRGLAVEARQRAVVAVVAQQPVDAVQLVEPGGNGCAQDR